GITVALELDLTPELRLEGLARELVRLVQDARRAAGLEVGDRIQLGIEATGEPAEALAAHREYVAGETLATMVADTGVPDPLYRQEASVDGARVTVTLRRA
ncbi:MAG: hypothetical protein HYU54_11545, partial [Actinobacteria bacterium]|nr:hypothetical protein [Actinomycetota bacterium]